MKAKITYRIRHLVSKFKSLTTAKQILILTFLFSAVFSWLIGALIGTFSGGSRLFFASFFRVLFSYPALFIVCLLAGGFLAVFLYYTFPQKHQGMYDKIRNFTTSNEGTYGTAHLQSEEEQAETLNFNSLKAGEENPEVLIGMNAEEDRIITMTERAYDKMTGKLKQDFNPNILICGSQGSMKTASFFNNYIEKCRKRKESMIINDTKGDLYENWHEALEADGYIVKIWNTKDFRYSDSWNLLQELRYMDMTTFVTAIMVNSGERQESSNDFFDNADANLLRALFHYVTESKTVAEPDRTFKYAYEIFMTQDPDNLEKLFESVPSAKMAYGMFKKAPKVAGNAFLSTGARLQVFQDKLVQKMTSHDDIDIELPAAKKCAYFCVSDDQTDSKDILNGMFFSFAIERMIKYADTHGKHVAVPWVRIIWDEFLNGVKVASMLRKLGTARSRGIGFVFGIQSIPYMQQVWPDTQWESILAGCDLQILLGCNDLTTAQHFSDLSGQSSIVVSTKAKNFRTLRVTDYVGSYRQNTSVGQRQVLNPDEVLSMDMWDQIVRLRGKQLLICKKRLFYDRPVAKEVLAHTSPYYMHTPAYLKENCGLGADAPDCLRTLWICGNITKEEVIVRAFGDRNSDNPHPEFTPDYIADNLTAGEILDIFSPEELMELFGTSDAGELKKRCRKEPQAGRREKIVREDPAPAFGYAAAGNEPEKKADAKSRQQAANAKAAEKAAKKEEVSQLMGAYVKNMDAGLAEEGFADFLTQLNNNEAYLQEEASRTEGYAVVIKGKKKKM